jgi:hypothetical protein
MHSRKLQKMWVMISPQEREKLLRRLWKYKRLDWSNHRSWISVRDSEKSSPGGEDLGEGGHLTNPPSS